MQHARQLAAVLALAGLCYGAWANALTFEDPKSVRLFELSLILFGFCFTCALA